MPTWKPLLLSLAPKRDLHYSKFVLGVDGAVIISAVGLISALLITSLWETKYIVAPVSASDLLARGENLFEHGCRCQNSSIVYGEFVQYGLTDSDYQFCDGTFRNLTGRGGQIICWTATYAICNMFNAHGWTTGQDLVLSAAKIREDVANAIRMQVFNAWNTHSDSIWVTDLLVNNTALADAEYKRLLAVEQHLPALTARIMSNLHISNSRYLALCDARKCNEQLIMSTNAKVLEAIGTCAGYISLCITIGTIIISIPEDWYLDRLYTRWHARSDMDKSLRAFLAANYPTAAFEMMRLKIKKLENSIKSLSRVDESISHMPMPDTPVSRKPPETPVSRKPRVDNPHTITISSNSHPPTPISRGITPSRKQLKPSVTFGSLNVPNANPSSSLDVGIRMLPSGGMLRLPPIQSRHQEPLPSN